MHYHEDDPCCRPYMMWQNAAITKCNFSSKLQVLSLPALQVDYTGFSTINAQRFGQKFVGKVANPHDILLWHKAPARKAKVGVQHILLHTAKDGQIDSYAVFGIVVLLSALSACCIA